MVYYILVILHIILVKFVCFLKCVSGTLQAHSKAIKQKRSMTVQYTYGVSCTIMFRYVFYIIFCVRSRHGREGKNIFTTVEHAYSVIYEVYYYYSNSNFVIYCFKCAYQAR